MPSPDQSIPLESVRLALLVSAVRARLPADQRPARYAAYARYPLALHACRERRRYRQPPLRGPQLGPMHQGDLDSVLERARLMRGLAEVKRTWGAGMRALKVEFADGMMR